MKFLAIPAFLAVALAGSEHKPQALADVTPPIEIVEEVKPIAKTWKCSGCNEAEARTLEFLQERGITDRAALATVLGNIRSESMFHTDICEGGARGPYRTCRSGGFGLIQWTTINRYEGLGNFCEKYGLDPNALEGQLRYMVNEVQWTRYEPYLKSGGHSIDYYMRHAYSWLGWGIEGSRSQYAHDYYNKMALA